MGDKKKSKVSASLAESKSNKVVMQQRGIFYNAFSDSARVLSAITGFKIKQESPTAQPKCGFPLGSLDKVCSLLKENAVSYEAYQKEKCVASYSFLWNRYGKILSSFNEDSIIRSWEIDGKNGDSKKMSAADQSCGEEDKANGNDKKLIHPVLDFLKKKAGFCFFFFVFCAGIFCLVFVRRGVNVSANSADTGNRFVSAFERPMDVVLCDCSTIPVSLNIPSVVSDADVDAYMDQVLAGIGGDCDHGSVTDEYCTENLGVGSVDEFRAALKSDLYSYKNEYVNGYIDGAVKFYVTEKSEIRMEPDIYDEMFEDRVDQQVALFINQYCDGDSSLYEEKAKELTVYDNISDLESFLRDTVKESFDSNIVLLAVADKEGIKASGEDFDSWVSDICASQGFADAESLYAYYDTEYESGKDYIKEQYLYDKASRLLLENVSVIYDEKALITDKMAEDGQGG